jgi:cytochrome c oxidase assembly factor CtaG
VLAHPAIALPLWVADLYLWHLPPLYQAAVSHDLVHALQHVSFLAFGVNMWLALLGPLPAPVWFGNGAKLAYLVVVRLAGALLGNVFIWSEKVFYPDYRHGQAGWSISPLHDQGVAGTIMMVEGSLVTIVLLGWLFMKTAREAEERQLLVEFAQRHGLELSQKRAARAVGAGRGAELRRRLEQAAQ